METNLHDMPSLFEQLGLPSDEGSIQTFIDQHSLTPETTLFDANFWTESQSRFLRDQIKADADWAVVIDTLDTSLRK